MAVVESKSAMRFAEFHWHKTSMGEVTGECSGLQIYFCISTCLQNSCHTMQHAQGCDRFWCTVHLNLNGGFNGSKTTTLLQRKTYCLLDTAQLQQQFCTTDSHTFCDCCHRPSHIPGVAAPSRALDPARGLSRLKSMKSLSSCITV